MKVLVNLDSWCTSPQVFQDLLMGSQRERLAQQPHSCLSMAQLWDQPSVWQSLPGA